MNVNPENSAIFSSERTPAIISVVGVAFLLSSVGEWVFFHGMRRFGSVDFLTSFLISACFTVAIVHGGFRLERSDLPHERYPRIVAWIVGCAMLFFAVNVPIMVAWVPNTWPAQIWWSRFVVSVGLIPLRPRRE